MRAAVEGPAGNCHFIPFGRSGDSDLRGLNLFGLSLAVTLRMAFRAKCTG